MSRMGKQNANQTVMDGRGHCSVQVSSPPKQLARLVIPNITPFLAFQELCAFLLCGGSVGDAHVDPLLPSFAFQHPDT